MNTLQNNLATSLRAAILALSFWLLSLNLTVLSGSLAAVIGCIVTCFASERLLAKPPLARLRIGSILGLALIIGLLGSFVASMITGSALLASALAPITVFNSGEVINWLSLTVAITLALRALARRTGWGAVLEILFVAAACAWVLSAHRNGMIHRPFLIGDFALTRGIDPAHILMLFGCVAVLALATLLMIERQQHRLPYHFAALAVLCLSVVGYVQFFGLPTPQLTNDLGLTGQAQTGRSTARDNPFRDGENDAQDREAPVAVVVFRDDYEPINGAYYFRESAYSQFNGTMLDFASREDLDVDLMENFTNSRVETAQAPGSPDQRSDVRTTIGMLVAHRSPFGLESPVAYENRPNPNNLRFKRTYDAYSLAPEYDYNNMIGRETGREDWSEEVWQEYLALPDDPRYEALASELIGNLRPQYADDPFAKAWAIKTYLDENGIYSLQNDHAYESDPAASFLFGDLTGYCMHFSFAATYLYRSIGIPARVGIGYSVPASNRGGGSSLLVQAVHGHAWPEVYFRDVGWVIIDPAPQQTLVDMSTDPQNDLQQLLGDMLRDDATFSDYLESQQNSFIDLMALRNALLLGALLLLTAAYAVKLYRFFVPYSGRDEFQYRLSYRATLDSLAGVGLRRNPGESREQFAARAGDVTPGLTVLTRAHLTCALGGSTISDRHQWRQMRAAVSADLRRNIPAWRRALSAANPFTWLLSR